MGNEHTLECTVDVAKRRALGDGILEAARTKGGVETPPDARRVEVEETREIEGDEVDGTLAHDPNLGSRRERDVMQR
jgi:hypothetical protein